MVYTTTLSDNIPALQTYRFSNSKKIVRENGDEVALLEMSLTSLISADNGKFGKHYIQAKDAHYQGALGELIIFTRALKDSEILQAESYLRNKWSLKY